MKEFSFEEVKLQQLEILKCIDSFCVKNGLNYSLAYGTLIGAVRHKGYIPWDDDIDIMMPRKDYERFIYSFNGTFNHLSVLSPEIDSDYYAPYANVYDNRTLLTEGINGHRGFQIGIKIDIFPIDYVSGDKETYFKDMYHVERINYIMYLKRMTLDGCFRKDFKKTIKVCLCKFLFSFLPYSFLQNEIKKVVRRHSISSSEYVDNVVYNIYSKKCTSFHKTVLGNYIRIPFEGVEFNVIKDYDSVLRRIYGDYMQLPPLEKRVAHHDFKAYWKD